MLDLKLLQKNPEVVAAALAKRHSPLSMRTFEELDNKRRELLAEVEALKAERNRASGEVARLKRAGEDASALIAGLSDLSARIGALDSATDAVKADLADWMLTVPNIPDASRCPTAWTKTTTWNSTAGERPAPSTSRRRTIGT